jgi:hypothetical protein
MNQRWAFIKVAMFACMKALALVSACSFIFVASLDCRSTFGQPAGPAPQLGTFHVHGSIVKTYDKSAVSGAAVTFESKTNSKTVLSDDRGIYEADLPLGTYTMTARAQDKHLEIYKRPPFRVMSAMDLVFDISLDALELIACDSGVPSSGRMPDENDVSDACGGSDVFTLPSVHGVQFQMFIRFAHRERTDHLYAYAKWPVARYSPVFVAYNLFTLRANQVVYDEQTQTLHAEGYVVATNEKGEVRRADSMAFRIENGEAIQLQ